MSCTNKNKSTLKINIVTECGRKFSIDAHEVIHNRSEYYANIDKDTTYDEEYSFLEEDTSEILDWLLNNMYWYKCKTLVELPKPKTPLSELEIEEATIEPNDSCD